MRTGLGLVVLLTACGLAFAGYSGRLGDEVGEPAQLLFVAVMAFLALLLFRSARRRR